MKCTSRDTLTYNVKMLAANETLGTYKYVGISQLLTGLDNLLHIEVIHITCNMGGHDLPDMYALSPRA